MGALRVLGMFVVVFALALVFGKNSPVAAAQPIAIDDGGFQTSMNTELLISIATLLQNDIDDGQISLDPLNPPIASNGTAVVEGASIRYTPNSGFTGSELIAYTIVDNENLRDSANVSVTVLAPNSPPTAQDDEYLMGRNETLTVQGGAGVLTNDGDADQDTITVNGYNASNVPGNLQFNTATGGFSFTPPNDFVGTVQFTYNITDGVAVSNDATVTIFVQGPSSPPVANNDSYATDVDSQLNVPEPGVLANDSDVEEQPLTAQLSAGSRYGGTVQLNADGSFSYMPPAGFTGVDSFVYRAFDGSLTSSEASVRIAVGGNAPPIAGNDEFQTGRNEPITITFSQLLANDTDPNGDQLSVSLAGFTQPTSGTLTVDARNGQVVYTPDDDFIGADTFTYIVADGIEPGDAPGTVRVTVTNLVPTAPADATATSTPSATATAGPVGGRTATKAVGGTTVTTLPSTGAGSDPADATHWLLVLCLLVVAGTCAGRRRVRKEQRG